MLDIQAFGRELTGTGFRFFSGVPCSFLKDLINYAINNCQYITAANEGDAVASCAGASLGGNKAVFLCQNSGLTNAVSPLTSLNYIFKIPVLGFVSLRGEVGLTDEPQHELMGTITTGLLDLMQIKWEYLSSDLREAINQLKRANEAIESRQSFFFVVKKGLFSEEKLQPQVFEMRAKQTPRMTQRNKEDALPTRLEVLTKLSSLKDKDSVLLATTGKTGRELYEIEDAPNNFYMVGSMGCISPLALGLSLTKKNKRVIAIDGDGAVLMRLGALATNGYYCPDNMLHIVLDNNSYDSTGGQLTVSERVDFVEMATSVGYSHSIYVHDLGELDACINRWKLAGGLTFLYIKIARGSKEELGRPKTKPYQVTERLMHFLND